MEILDIKYKDVTIEIHGDYSPEEAEVRYYSDGSGHPGCSAEFDICHIFCGSTDIIELLENDIEILSELCIEKLTEL